ncbi:TonB-dependent receptor [uncultured Mucilaginibacter sp.]|uniref:SusC/RagA family TonB-linked outer membrane protein n=1 Tax=uncultured Mucilaginibacter sp. TaxID=797541 RepID=UPI00262BEFE9|nr:TonB-dependent receptor [uncultured Mucilaginibacter sp.]
MKKILQTFLLFLFLIASEAYAQTRTVSGTVVGKDDGLPLPGVSVVVRGTKSGSQTDAAGRYSVTVPAGSSNTLVFTFIGYDTQEIAATNNTVNVSLIATSKELSEVVVNGYTVQSRKDFTGSAAHIGADAFQSKPVQSFDQALAGQAAGVSATVPNGVLNNPPVVRIRGFNSLSLSSDPLYIVDGLQVVTGQVGNSASNSPLSDINPDDIESVEILKDASSTAIYGSRAANGVVVITTKKGRKGKTIVNYSGWYGFSKPMNLPAVLNAQQYVTLKNEARTNANLTPVFSLQNINGSQVNTRWYDYAYRTGQSQNHSLSISGGTDQTNYFLSANYSDQGGFIVKNNYDRKAIRANVQHQLVKNINIGANFSYSNSLNSGVNSGSLSGQAYNTGGLARLAILLPPNLSPYNADGSYNLSASNSIGLQNGISGVTISYYNPVPLLDLDRYTSENNNIISNVYAQWELVKGLTAKTSYGLEYLNVTNETFQNPIEGDGYTTNGSAINVQQKYTITDWTNTLNYSHSFGGNFNLNALVGYERLGTNVDNWGAQETGVSDPFYTTYQGGFNTYLPSGNNQYATAFQSYFSNLTFDYKKKYLINGSFRRDGISQLAAGHKYGDFGGASIGWVLSEENFFKNSALANVLSDVKIRGGYGVVGNSNGLAPYAALSSYTSVLYGSSAALQFNQAGNQNLKWETSKKTDVGLNFALLNGRIAIDADYYYNNIDGLIQQARQAPSTGIPGATAATLNTIFANVGSMWNKGFELGVTVKAISVKNFNWTTNFNFSTNKNRVTTLANNNADLYGSTSSLETSNITRVGYPVGSLFTVQTAGVNPANGRRIFINRFGKQVQYNQVGSPSKWTYLDGTTAPAIDGTLDGIVAGNAIPTYFGGFNNNFSYKNFDLTLNFTYSGGNKIYYGTRGTLLDQRFWNNTTEVLNRWTTVGQVTDIPKVVYGDNYSNGSAIPISANVESGAYAKLKTASLGYRIPARYLSKVGISSIRIYAQGYNLYTLTKYKGSDPEISSNGNSNTAPGDDRNSVPSGRTFTFGINVGF